MLGSTQQKSFQNDIAKQIEMFGFLKTHPQTFANLFEWSMSRSALTMFSRFYNALFNLCKENVAHIESV